MKTPYVILDLKDRSIVADAVVCEETGQFQPDTLDSRQQSGRFRVWLFAQPCDTHRCATAEELARVATRKHIFAPMPTPPNK
jgi:hypothetical protein